MSKNIPSTISKDFPLYHSEAIPTYQDPHEVKHTFKLSPVSNTYTNEHPDLFRLDTMKEGGYRNPYLNQVIKVDRNENFKKLNSIRNNLNLIDFIKSNRKYSQEPKILRYIKNESDVVLNKKRHAFKSMDKNNNNKDENQFLKTEGNLKESSVMLRKLNFFIPKIDFKMKNTLSINNSPTKDSSIVVNKDVHSRGNFKNSSEFDKKSDNQSDFYFKRKPVIRYNPIKDGMEEITPPPFKNQKWTSFFENYFAVMNSRRQFKKQGGLFSEFANKNITSILNEKYDIQQRIKRNKKDKNSRNLTQEIRLKKY